MFSWKRSSCPHLSEKMSRKGKKSMVSSARGREFGPAITAIRLLCRDHMLNRTRAIPRCWYRALQWNYSECHILKFLLPCPCRIFWSPLPLLLRGRSSLKCVWSSRCLNLFLPRALNLNWDLLLLFIVNTSSWKEQNSNFWAICLRSKKLRLG